MSKVVKPKRPPKTIKEKKFVREYIKTGNATEAAARVYDVKLRDTARNIGAQNVAKLSLVDVMNEHGISEEYLTSKLNEGLNATKVISANIVITRSDDPTVEQQSAHSATKDFIDVEDFAIRHKYLETAYKLRGDLQNNAVNLNVDSDNTNIQINITRDTKLEDANS